MKRIHSPLHRIVPAFVLIPLLLMAGVASPVKVAAEEQKPNFLYIMADDQGWKDVGFHGSDIKTPQLDKLAETGAQFEQF